MPSRPQEYLLEWNTLWKGQWYHGEMVRDVYYLVETRIFLVNAKAVLADRQGREHHIKALIYCRKVGPWWGLTNIVLSQSEDEHW